MDRQARDAARGQLPPQVVATVRSLRERPTDQLRFASGKDRVVVALSLAAALGGAREHLLDAAQRREGPRDAPAGLGERTYVSPVAAPGVMAVVVAQGQIRQHGLRERPVQL
jgi:hypothetical protein